MSGGWEEAAVRDVECGCFPEDETVLKTFTWWTAKLNPRQDYPGKVLLALRRHEEDVLVLKLEERRGGVGGGQDPACSRRPCPPSEVFSWLLDNVKEALRA